MGNGVRNKVWIKAVSSAQRSANFCQVSWLRQPVDQHQMFFVFNVIIMSSS